MEEASTQSRTRSRDLNKVCCVVHAFELNSLTERAHRFVDEPNETSTRPIGEGENADQSGSPRPKDHMENGMTQQLGINRPSVPIYITSLLLALVAVAGWLLPVPFVTERVFWIAISAYAVLALGVLGVLVFEISNRDTPRRASMARLGDMHLV
jgi:hypothetical protein